MTDSHNCSEVMDKFLELDKNEHIPLWISKHLISCPTCRKNVKMISQAEKFLNQEGSFQDPFTFSTLSDVKEKIFPGSTKEKKVPIIQWLVAGIILVICMVLGSIAVNKYFPEFQTFSFIFVAGALIAYCMLFIGFNMEFLKNKSN